MIKKGQLLLALLSLAFFVNAQSDTLKHRIFLVGDAGELVGNEHPLMDWLKRNVDWDDERNVVLFLGDNIYPEGMPAKGEPGYPLAKRILDYQISLVKGKKSKAYFVPGNHDWKAGKIGGLEYIKNQANYISSLELKNVEFWPKEGCPGPDEIPLSDSVVFVFMDSQWWLHVHDKPGLESHCETKTQDEIITSLEEIVATHPNHLIIVAMHHPLFSYGVHGGNYTLRHHIFPFTEVWRQLYIPLPVIGSIYPVARGVFGNIQDVKHPVYRTMIREIENVLKKHSNIIHVSGHDHALQMLIKDSVTYIVSGSGSKISRVKTGKNLIYGEPLVGFSTIEVYKSGKVFSKFYSQVSDGILTPTFTKELKTIVQPEKEEAAYTRYTALPDSIVATANPTLEANWLRRLFMGENYRKEWTEQIRVKVLDIKSEFGGLKATERGGGKQTKSLRLVDSTGKEYALRSIKKFPTTAIPPELRETFIKDLVEDGISASYPYASLSMGPLTRAVGLPYLRTQLVYVVDDTTLGRFLLDFANTLGMLEEREPAYISKTYNTDELVVRLLKDNDDHVNQKSVLMSRILDMYIMDFDRHEDQWRWFTTDTGRGKIYNPIPRDRDQAFFVNQGLIPWFMKKRPLIPDIQGFRPKAYSIKTFNKSARNFDRAFLTELDQYQWEHMTDSLLSKMTDEVIERSLQLQPREIRNYNAGKIIQTLKERRKYLKSDVLKYYRFISRIVSVTGSNQKELFTITRNANGTVQVIVNKIDNKGAISSKIYDRLFDPAITKELRIYGLGGHDKFVFSGANNDILIRIIGGPGDDEFNSNDNSNRTLVYDASFEKNIFTGNKNFKNKISADPAVNDYNRLSYKYNILNGGVTATYNQDDGFSLGLELVLMTHGFRKEPYKSLHHLGIYHSLSTGSYNFKYNATLVDLLGRSDIILKTDLKMPVNVQNFFGFGNKTVFDKSTGKNAEYYRADYNIADVSLLARRSLQSWMFVNYGLAFQYYKLDSTKNLGRYINNFLINGLDPKNTHNRSKTYVGPEIFIDIDNRNNKVFPTRGTTLNMGARTLFGLNNSKIYTRVNFDLAVYISVVEETKVVFATRFGWARNYGKYEFFQAQYLGGDDNLRGYHNNRFAGRSRLFNNSEIRVRVTEFKTYFFPGSAGLLFFYDIGKVREKDLPSKGWHTGYGAGIWVAPLRRFVITGSYAMSKESKLPMLTFGFQF